MDDIKIVKSDSESITEQKRCPSCNSADIEFNPITGKLRCNYCKYEFEKEKVQGFVKNLKELEGTVVGACALNIDNSNNDNIITCKCSGCGAEITLDANEIAFKKCHWCHSGLSLNEQVPSGIVPDAILPFKVTREEAFEDMKKIVEKKTFFADTQFLQEFNIENLRGVYLPYMTVDINGHGKFKGKGQKIIQANFSEDEHGDRYESSYDVDIYEVEREFDIQIENLLETTDSKQLNWKKIKKTDRATFVLETLMPFDIENCVKWDANYLNGYSIEKRDTNIGDISDRMGLKAKDVTRFKLNRDFDYDGGVNWEEEELEIYGQQWKAVYLPVWIYSYTQHTSRGDYTYFIAENARTKELNYTVPLNITKTIISLIISMVFPIIGIIILCMIMSYIKLDNRNRHERETKAAISNVYRKDEFIKHKNKQKSAYIKGANNERIEGDK